MAAKTMAQNKLSTFKNILFHERCFSTASKNTTNHYDIIIAGGGMVGAALACALGHNKKLASKRILVLEGGPKRNLPQKKPNDLYSNRVVSLNPGTKKFFDSIGVWDTISPSRYATVKKMQVWDSCSQAFITFDQPGLVGDISYIVENDVVLHALDRKLETVKDQVDVKNDSRVGIITLPHSTSTKPCIEMKNQSDAYTCDLLIGAEGYGSATRQAMGIQWLTWSYQQSGVVATLRLAEPTENVVAWQRFLPNGSGPIALLPLTNELSSLVWSTTGKEASRLLKLDDETFVDAVNDALWKRGEEQPLIESLNRLLERNLGVSAMAGQQLPPSVQEVVPNSRACFPLGFGHAAKYVAPAVALIGDAAHRVHPLAGLGVNLGLGDAECLANILAEAVYSGQKLGALGPLQEYQRQRQCHNFPTMVAIDALQKLYSSSATPVVVLRSLGMQITHAIPPLKRAIINHASG